MSLYDAKRECTFYARKLPKKYEDYDITELANNYCKALDEDDGENKNIYLSALMLRFWYQIDRIYTSVKHLGYEREDIFYKLYELIEVACHYRAWQNPEKNTNAQACINQVIACRGVPAILGLASYQKNNHIALSLDDPISDDGESTFADTIEDESVNLVDNAKYIIQSMITNNKVVEAIIADTIAYNDVFKHSKKTVKTVNSDGENYKYVNHSSEFWPFKVVQELNNIDYDSYKSYFLKKYSVGDEILENALNTLNKYNNQKKYKVIAKSLENMKAFVM